MLPEVGLILILHVALMLRTKANPNSASYGAAIAGVEIAPLTPSIGAVVSSVGLAHNLQDPTIEAASNQAFLDHHVLVFRDQELTREQHQDFGRRFGPLHVHPSQCHDDYEGDQEIFPVEADETIARNDASRNETVASTVTEGLTPRDGGSDPA